MQSTNQKKAVSLVVKVTLFTILIFLISTVIMVFLMLVEETFSRGNMFLLTLLLVTILFIAIVIWSLIFSDIKEANQNTQKIIDGMPFGIYMWDKNGNSLGCNQATLNFFKIKTKEEYINRFRDFWPEYQPSGQLSVNEAGKYIETAIKEGAVSFDWTNLASDGELLPCELTLVRIDKRKDFYLVAYFRDLREHKRLVRELEDAANKNTDHLAKLNLVIKTAMIGLWEIDFVMGDPLNPKNKANWSDEFRQLLGYENENDFPNKISSSNERVHPDDFIRTSKVFLEHLMDKSGKTPYDIEYRIKKKSGEYAWFRATGETMRDEEGYPVRTVGSLLDLTETKDLIAEAERQQKAAEDANRAKSEFLSHMSHELRNPMNAVLGATEIQLQNDFLPPNIEETFNVIYSSGNLILNIINDLLDLSKIEAGKLLLAPVKYDIPALLYDTIQLSIHWYESKPIDFKLNVDKDTPLFLYGDEIRIKQVLSNILSNAFKYTEEGTVEFNVSIEAEDTMVFQIKDTGQGMTKDQTSRIFDRYERFNIETNRSIIGTGLGMDITKSLIDLMGGEILVDSEPGRGTIFTVRLKQKRVNNLVCGEKLNDELNSSRFQSMSKLRKSRILYDFMPYGSVLIVDDVESNLFVARGMLLPYGLKIETVTSGLEAVEKIKNGNVYDIIFMDHIMPEMDGIEATRLIRKMSYNRPVVALTANVQTGQAEKFMEEGFDGFIAKPIDMRDLNSVLCSMIRDKHPPEVTAAARKQKRQEESERDFEPEQAREALSEKMAEAVIRDINNALVVIEHELFKVRNYESTGLKSFITVVHGMKNVLYNVGETDLSAMAYKLEEAGKNEEMPLISSLVPEFMEGLRGIAVKLKPVKADRKSTDKLNGDDLTYLKDLLGEIIPACDTFDKKTIKDILAKLGQKAWPDEISDVLEKMSVLLLHGKFKDIAANTEDLLLFTSNEIRA